MSEIKQFVTVVSNEVSQKKDTNGKEFNVITVSQGGTQLVKNIDGTFQTVLSAPKTTKFSQYKESYINNGAPDHFYNVEPGDLILGGIVQKEVEPYEFMGKTQNKATVFIQWDSTDPLFDTKVREAFEGSNHTLLEETAEEESEAQVNQESEIAETAD